MKKELLLVGVLIFLISGIIVVLAFHLQFTSLPYVDLNSPNKLILKVNTHNHGVTFAVATMWSPEETFLLYRKFGETLGKMVGEKETFVIRPNYRETRVELEQGIIDAALVCTGTYLNSYASGKVEILAVPELKKGLAYRGVIISSSDSNIKSINDLHGKVMAFTDPESNTGCIVPYSAILSVTPSPKSFLGKIVFTGSHDLSIEAVASHIVDAAGVDSLVLNSMIEMHPALKNKIHIIWMSKPYGPPMILVNKGLNEQLKERLETALLNMHKYPEGKKVLESLGIERFTTAAPYLYSPAFRVFYKVRDSKDTVCR